MNKRFIFPELAAAPGSSELTETLGLHYHEETGLYVVEHHQVPIHFPTIRLERELNKAIKFGLESLKGRLINIHV
jgi:hypothetical protein